MFTNRIAPWSLDADDVQRICLLCDRTPLRSELVGRGSRTNSGKITRADLAELRGRLTTIAAEGTCHHSVASSLAHDFFCGCTRFLLRVSYSGRSLIGIAENIFEASKSSLSEVECSCTFQSLVSLMMTHSFFSSWISIRSHTHYFIPRLINL